MEGEERERKAEEREIREPVTGDGSYLAGGEGEAKSTTENFLDIWDEAIFGNRDDIEEEEEEEEE